MSAGDETAEASRGAMFRFNAGERHALASDEGARVLLILAPWPGPGHYQPGEEPHRGVRDDA
jgi:hypothetical protein